MIEAATLQSMILRCLFLFQTWIFMMLKQNSDWLFQHLGIGFVAAGFFVKVNSSFFLQLCQHSVNVWITRSICGWMCAGIVPAVTATLFTSDHCRRNTTVSTATFYCVCVCVLMSQIVPRLAPGWQVELMLPGKSNQWSQ